MDKPANLSGQSNAESVAPPHCILCNSEHFIVINPVRRTKPNPPYRPDESHSDPAAPSKQFQAALETTRQKGRLLRPRQ